MGDKALPSRHEIIPHGKKTHPRPSLQRGLQRASIRPRLFHLVLSKREFELFNWKTLHCELTDYVDEEWREKRTDLIFSVALKNSQKRAKILFLLEHKGQTDKTLFPQLLAYQSAMYSRQNYPVIPILIYQGRGPYKGPRDFHAHLKALRPSVGSAFKKNILNFTPKVLDIQALVSSVTKNLTTKPILYIMQSIYRLNTAKIEELFIMGRDIPLREREALMERAVDYIRQYDKKFTWKVLQEIEEKVLPEEDRIMPALKFSLDEAREEGIEKGIEKGMEKGKEEVALRMLQEKTDLRLIYRFTGLSSEKLWALSQKLKNSPD